jgi:hypothetical protein
MTDHRRRFLGHLVAVLVLGGVAQGEMLTRIPICHIPPGDPDDARIIIVSPAALDAHLGHGDATVPEDLTCTDGVGECAVDGFLRCTGAGVVCEASATPPPEGVETSCADGRDNDCDGRIDAADADCAACPSSTGLEAAITRQIEHKEEGVCLVEVRIISRTDQPVQVLARSVDAPEGVITDLLQTTSCNASGLFEGVFICQHDMLFDFTDQGSFDGAYTLHLGIQCDPVMPLCPLCTRDEDQLIEFSLDGTDCDTFEIPVDPGEVTGTVWFDDDGDGSRDGDDPPLGTGSGVTVEIYEDSNTDGLPDGAAIATSPTDANGLYGFAGLDGTYVLRAVGAAGTCSSSGPDSQVDGNTGYTFPLTVLAASPKQVLSGVDIGLTSACGP